MLITLARFLLGPSLKPGLSGEAALFRACLLPTELCCMLLLTVPVAAAWRSACQHTHVSVTTHKAVDQDVQALRAAAFESTTAAEAIREAHSLQHHTKKTHTWGDVQNHCSTMPNAD